MYMMIQKPHFQKRAKRMRGPKKINNFMQKAWFFFEKKCEKRGFKNGDSAAEVPQKSTLEVMKNEQKPIKKQGFLQKHDFQKRPFRMRGPS